MCKRLSKSQQLLSSYKQLLSQTKIQPMKRNIFSILQVQPNQQKQFLRNSTFLLPNSVVSSQRCWAIKRETLGNRKKRNFNSILRKSVSELSGEILKEPFIDNFLTHLDQIAFSLSSLKKTLRLDVKVGDYVNCGDKIGENGKIPVIVCASGKIIRINKKQILLQKTQPVLYYSQASVHVKKGHWVTQGAPILTLTHQTLVTGDIVQGIPRIEQLFEAPNSPPPGMRGGENLQQTMHSQVREIFRKNWIQLPLPSAVRNSLQQIQQILVESIQKVYLSQGVLIADKHVEIVVRQMTSKAEVLESGNTGLLLEELLPVQQIENANLTTPGKKALYAPAVIGLTRSALESDSFISAASFQETTRVLSRDAITGKSDFLRGLKEKVVIGDLISAGTGLDLYFMYTLLSHEQFHPVFQIPKKETIKKRSLSNLGLAQFTGKPR